MPLHQSPTQWWRTAPCPFISLPRRQWWKPLQASKGARGMGQSRSPWQQATKGHPSWDHVYYAVMDLMPCWSVLVWGSYQGSRLCLLLWSSYQGSRQCLLVWGSHPGSHLCLLNDKLYSALASSVNSCTKGVIWVIWPTPPKRSAKSVDEAQLCGPSLPRGRETVPVFPEEGKPGPSLPRRRENPVPAFPEEGKPSPSLP